ncbi:MAG TPA: hypothetical protein VH088_22685, partial [Terriglobales bacterium]|nr:hypothetical protein [Terriglobales bacterium]
MALATVVVPAISSTAQTLIHTGNAYLDHPLSSGAKTFSAFASVAKKPSALTILPTFDASITDDPNAADIEAAINAAITQLETHIVTPTTVKIMFVNVNNGLGGSATFYNNVPYSQYRTDMKKVQALSDNDRKALKTLPAGVSNPVDGTPTVRLTLPLLRAVGEAALGDLGVDVDSTIFLNVPITNIS